MLPAGVPALSVMVASICVGATAGRCAAPPAERALSTLATAVATPSAALWVWALSRSFAGTPDLGVISFALAMCGAAAYYPRGSFWCGASRRALLWSVGCGAVAVNFGIGVTLLCVQGFMPDRRLLLLYYCAGAAYWAGAGVYGSALLCRSRRARDDVDGILHSGD